MQQAREAGRRALCQANLHNLGIAVANYMDTNRFAPPDKNPYSQSATGAPANNGWYAINSWHLILPFLEAQAMSDGYNFLATMNSGRNSTVQRTIVQAYICPSDLSKVNNPNIIPNTQLSYSMSCGTIPIEIWGPGSAQDTGPWAYWISVKGNGFFRPVGGTCINYDGSKLTVPNSPVKMRDIADGTTKTFMYGEASRFVGMKEEFAFNWPGATTYWGTSEAWGAHIFGMAFSVPTINAAPSVGANYPPCDDSKADCGGNLQWVSGYPVNDYNGVGSPLGEWGFRSLHPAGANFVMVDATVHFIPTTIDKFIYAALGTTDGGEANHQF